MGNNPLRGVDPSGHFCTTHATGHQNPIGTEYQLDSCDTSAEWNCATVNTGCNKTRIGPVPGYSEAGRYGWRAGNDAAIIQETDYYNGARGYSPGDAGYLSPKMVKAWMMEESGGTVSAFLNDPMQVNVPGDWTDRKLEFGLSKGQSMTRVGDIFAGLNWLEFKGYGERMNQFGGYTGNYLGNRNALVNYNANTKIYPQDGGEQHRYHYADKILGNAAQMQ